MHSFLHVGKDLSPLNCSIGYPESEEVRPEFEEVANFLAYCLKVKRPGEYAQRGDFSPELLRSWIGYIMILDYPPEQNDFRYRIYGTAIAQQSGFDLTHKLAAEFKSETDDTLSQTIP